MYGYPEQFIPLPEIRAAATGPASAMGDDALPVPGARATRKPGEVPA